MDDVTLKSLDNFARYGLPAYVRKVVDTPEKVRAIFEAYLDAGVSRYEVSIRSLPKADYKRLLAAEESRFYREYLASLPSTK